MTAEPMSYAQLAVAVDWSQPGYQAPTGEVAPATPGQLLLDDVADLLTRFVSFPSAAAGDAVALWAMHTHALRAFESTPRLALLSPEKGSGKTRTLEVLDLLVPEPMHTVNCSVAALFRAASVGQPTVLMDEADTYFGYRVAEHHEELRVMVNAGHRRGAVAYRCVGQPSNMQVVALPAFAAVALAGIGDLPDTVLDRAVVIRVRRRAPHEVIQPFRHREVKPVADDLRVRLEAWAKASAAPLAAARPTMPEGLVDWPADVWEPLIAIADLAGGDWPGRARAAALALHAANAKDDPSLGVRLLADMRTVFGDGDRMSTEDLLVALCALDESPWATCAERNSTPGGSRFG